MVSGRRPWSEHRSVEAIALAQLFEPLPQLEGGDLAWLNVLLERLTAKKSGDRFESAADVAGASGQVAGSSRAQLLRWAIAGVLVALVVVLVLLLAINNSRR